MTRLFHITGILFLLMAFQSTAQNMDLLKQTIQQLLVQKNAVVGVSIVGNHGKEECSINGDKHFPMQSVFKFHIALAILNEVDKGVLSLDQQIPVTKSDLLPNTWSPLREKYPNGNVNIPLSEILEYSVQQSDNNGCDMLLRLIGGPKKVEAYIHGIGVKNVAIEANEAEMHRDWKVQFNNWTTPKAASYLLKLFYERKILSEKSHNYLWKLMSETATGMNRIKGQLPEGTIVAHKTGTSDTNEQGVTAAVNDIGIVRLPGGDAFFICIFVSNSKENMETNEKIIAAISKLACDYFKGKKN